MALRGIAYATLVAVIATPCFGFEPPTDSRRFAERPNVPAEPTQELIQHVSSTRVVISYQTAPGASPVTEVDVWHTDDQARTWTQLPKTDDLDVGRVIFDAPAEGLYGFFIVLKNQFGASDLPPRPGTPPHQWVRVDNSAPMVQIVEARPDADFYNNREITIRWRATDANMPDRPVRVHFRSQQTKSYRLIADDLPAQSSFRWTVPEEVWGRVSVKVTAVDRAANSGRNTLDSLMIESFSQGVRPAGGKGNGAIDERARPGSSRPEARPAGRAEPPAAVDVVGREPPATRALPGEPAAALARKRYQVGTWHRLNGEYAVAMARYREALRLDSSLIAAQNDLAGLLFLTGKHKAAEREFRQVLAVNPRHVPSLKSLALVQATRRNYRSAQSSLVRLLEIDSTDADAWLYLGDVTMFRGDRAAARQHWTKARGLAEASDDVRERAEKRLAIYRSNRLAVGSTTGS